MDVKYRPAEYALWFQEPTQVDIVSHSMGRRQVTVPSRPIFTTMSPEDAQFFDRMGSVLLVNLAQCTTFTLLYGMTLMKSKSSSIS